MSNTAPRHLALTIWLWLGIIVNALVSLYYILGQESLQALLPTVPKTTFILLAVLGVVNIACYIALLKWKKWGFWGLCGTTILAAVININTHISSPLQAIAISAISIGILYALLNVGTEKKAWPRLTN
jgi:hypothetical protein